MIKLNTPKAIALFTSFITGVLVVVLMVLASLFFDESIPWRYLLPAGLLTFLCSYFLFSFALEKFIYSKIKLIYKSIHDLKTQRDSGKVNLNRDILGDVDQEVRQWAEDKKEEIQQLREQETFRREFIGNLAHELKTPIFNIQGYLHTLIEGGLEDPKINREYLNRTDKNLDRLIDLVKDLDMIMRLESGNASLEKQKFNIVELTEDVFQSLEIISRDRNIKLGFDSEYENPVYVNADRGKIHQVLTNLMVNSIHYGKQNGKTTVGFHDMDRQIMIEVSDDGIGIKKPHLNRLFERFYRVDKSRSRLHGGSGLGLAIVKHIIDVHAQTISVRSEEGHGSTFSFTLEKSK